MARGCWRLREGVLGERERGGEGKARGWQEYVGGCEKVY